MTLTLPLNVLTRRLPSPPPPSSARTDRRLELCNVSGISEFSLPLKELNLTLPRAVPILLGIVSVVSVLAIADYTLALWRARAA